MFSKEIIFMIINYLFGITLVIVSVYIFKGSGYDCTYKTTKYAFLLLGIFLIISSFYILFRLIF